MSTPTSNLVFLTGGTGLVGGHLLIHLHKSGKNIRALIRSSSSFSQLKLICSFYGLPFETLKDSIEWVYGDTLDYVGLCDLMDGIEEVYHCAAVVSFNDQNKKELLQTNINGTSNMVDAAIRNKVKRFCFISSIGALGSAPDQDFIHEKTPRKGDKQVSAYSESKFRSELEVWRAASEGLNTVIVNPGVILGPGNPGKGSLLLFRNGRKGMPFYTKATTGYIDVRDVCRASMGLMEKRIYGKRFILVSDNIHNGNLFSMIAAEFGKKPPRIEAGKALLTIAALLSEAWGRITGKTAQLTMETIRTAQRPEKYSSKKICEVLDFKFIPLEQTVKDTCDFLKKNQL
jgi:dihydroflavonol-4-reductase